MSFDWSEYVELAEKLIEQEKDEKIESAYYRSSVSRSYYGTYCLARDLLLSKGFNIPRTNTHMAVREAFQQGSNRVIKQVGEGLGRLWSERKNADYDAPNSFDKVRAEKALKLAKKLLKLYSEAKVQEVAP
ncbi:MAG: HEPN domain-containing protein [Nitrospirota bacterium]|nr:HEPN domain-containing protein [Nitrospirota bacterium]